MSGSSHDWGNPAYSQVDETSLCEKLAFRTQLASPNIEILHKLKVGDQLAITLETKGSIVAVTKDKALTYVGGILSRNQSKLKNCLQNGFKFIAKITALDGGNCEIQIQVES